MKKRVTFGQGILTFPDGKQYLGEWKANSIEADKDDRGYKEGLKNGRLTYSADDGLRYEGGLKDGKYNETFTSSDGLRYESRV